MEIQIRKADTNDATTIAYLGRVTFSETFGHLFRDPQDLEDYLQRTFAVEKIQRSFLNKNNVFWVAYIKDTPVGYGKLKLNESSDKINLDLASQLQKIYVLKDHLSKKIGLYIQEEMLKEAKNKGSKTIWLSVLKENLRAINFYLKNGFVIEDEHDFRIGKELFHFHVMIKEL